MDPLFNVKIKPNILNINEKTYNIFDISFDSFTLNVTSNDIFILYKYKIDETTFDSDAFIQSGGYITQYMDNTIFMGEQLFLGGYDVEASPESIEITRNIAMGSKHIIDVEVEKGYTYVYQCIYNYDDHLYSFTLFSNLSSLTKKYNIKQNTVCIRNRNRIRRGFISYLDTKHDNIEVEQDLLSLYNNISEFNDSIKSLNNESSVIYKVYDIEEQIQTVLESVDIFGYGIGGYGKNGIYGLN